MNIVNEEFVAYFSVNNNVVGNSMSTQPSDSNPTKNEHTNSKKRKFEQ